MKYISIAKVFHKRLSPSINHFTYNVFYFCFDISKILKLKSIFCSVNKFNLFSIKKKDYGKRDGSCPKKWIYNILKEYDIENIEQIFLLTHPKILGFGFNPVSFWFCLDKKKNLKAVLAEVSNTFGENHNYLLFNNDKSSIKGNQWLEAKKEFHVSPFYHVRGKYKFRFIFNEKKIALWIDYFDNDKTLLTSLIAKNIELNDSNLLKQFIKMPFMIFKVIFLIHWQALKIFFKKNKYIKKPPKYEHNITISEKI